MDFVLGSGIRIKLLSHLARRPRTPTELATLERKHVSHISRALTDLRAKGLVEYVPTGSRERFYRPTDRGYALYYALVRLAR